MSPQRFDKSERARLKSSVQRKEECRSRRTIDLETVGRKESRIVVQRHSTELLRRIRWTLAVFLFGLIASGVTAFPLLKELEVLTTIRGLDQSTVSPANGLDYWILAVRNGLRECYSQHPWIAYGTDWLAFSHLAIAVFFIGPFVDPVRNVWVLKAGLILCVGVIPLALVCGEIRGIPIGWRLIDCSFGVVGAIPLYCCLRWTRELERIGNPIDRD
jgi:hypothetical protein